MYDRENHDGVITTKYWHSIADGRVVCDLCPRQCRLKEGQRGLCFIRANIGQQVVMTSYGRSSGFCIDPIEKKPLYHFLPGSPVLSFGTAGCNLSCRFCQNWDISRSQRMDTLADQASPERIATVAAQHGCASIAFTYNDPVPFHEYAIDVAFACHELGIKTVAVTAGYVSAQPRQEFYQMIDAANVDLKGFNESFYHRLTGGHLAPVLESLEYLYHQTDVWLELTTLLIPGHNDGEDEIAKMCQWVVEQLGPEVPMHFSAFHPAYRMLDIAPTPPATVQRARRIALQQGIYHAYCGNIVDPEGESSWCRHCGALLVGRQGYQISGWGLDDDGCCQRCGRRCAGVWAAKPGGWGGKREPIHLG